MTKSSLQLLGGDVAKSKFRLDLTDDGLYDLEGTVALFYCQQFYDCRGRAPLTPHRVRADLLPLWSSSTMHSVDAGFISAHVYWCQ